MVLGNKHICCRWSWSKPEVWLETEKTHGSLEAHTAEKCTEACNSCRVREYAHLKYWNIRTRMFWMPFQSPLQAGFTLSSRPALYWKGGDFHLLSVTEPQVQRAARGPLIAWQASHLLSHTSRLQEPHWQLVNFFFFMFNVWSLLLLLPTYVSETNPETTLFHSEQADLHTHPETHCLKKITGYKHTWVQYGCKITHSFRF